MREIAHQRYLLGFFYRAACDNITFQMTSNDVDFFGFRFISPKLARVTYLTYNRKHCTSHAT